MSIFFDLAQHTEFVFMALCKDRASSNARLVDNLLAAGIPRNAAILLLDCDVHRAALVPKAFLKAHSLFGPCYCLAKLVRSHDYFDRFQLYVTHRIMQVVDVVYLTQKRMCRWTRSGIVELFCFSVLLSFETLTTLVGNCIRTPHSLHLLRRGRSERKFFDSWKSGVALCTQVVARFITIANRLVVSSPKSLV